MQKSVSQKSDALLKLDELDGNWDFVELALARLEGGDDSKNNPDDWQYP